MEIVKIKKAKAHQKYFTQDGERVPGVTTVLGKRNKPALIPWANKIGLEGIQVGKYVDTLADIGTLTHARVEADFVNQEVDLSEYSEQDIELSDNSMLSFYEWKKDHVIAPIANELQLVSEAHKYGGTCDIYCGLDGKHVLIDIKTGKAIYDDHLLQLAAYANLLLEKAYLLDECWILNIPRSENEEFAERKIIDTNEYFEVFECYLRAYQLEKELKIR